MEPIGEGRDHAVEPVSMGRAAVQEAERWLARSPPLEQVQSEASDVNGAALGPLAPER